MLHQAEEERSPCNKSSTTATVVSLTSESCFTRRTLVVTLGNTSQAAPPRSGSSSTATHGSGQVVMVLF